MFKSFFYSRLTSTVLIMAMFTSLTSSAAETDPTSPFGHSGYAGTNPLKTDGGFTLTSIIHGDGIHTAVINGKIYKMFDYISGYQVTAINSHSVVLRSKSKRLKINVFKSKGFKSRVVENTEAN